jgi:hypothetical protein
MIIQVTASRWTTRATARLVIGGVAVAALAGCGSESQPGSPVDRNVPALVDYATLQARPFRTVTNDVAGLAKAGKRSSFRPELARALIRQVRTTKTRVCAGESLLVDAQADGTGGDDVEVTIQGQRNLPAVVSFQSTGQRVIPVVARLMKDKTVIGVDRSETTVDVVDCPNKPLAEVLVQPGETGETAVVRVFRVQGLPGGDRVTRRLEGLHYRYDFGDGAVVESDSPTASHKYEVAAVGGRQVRSHHYIQVTAVDDNGNTALGRQSYSFRYRPGIPSGGLAVQDPPPEAPELVTERMQRHQADLVRNEATLERTIARLRAEAAGATSR